jgi:S-DNA-T family DNA segregation ATPase FtsK/SpoIIIE
MAKRPSSSKRSSSKKSVKPIQHIPPETKKDIIGGLLLVIGVISLLGFFTGENGVVSGWFSHLLMMIAGWGGVVLPLVIMVCGIWLLFRNSDKLPRISPSRISGIVLLYFNLLTWFHFSIHGDYTTVSQLRGGGYLGAFFTWILTSSLGNVGTVVVLLAFLLVAALFILDLPLSEISKLISSLFRGKEPAPKVAAVEKVKPVKTISQPVQTVQKKQVFAESEPLPAGFNPISMEEEPASLKKVPVYLVPNKKADESSSTPVQRTNPVSTAGTQTNNTSIKHSSTSSTSVPVNTGDKKPVPEPVIEPVKPVKPVKPWPMPSIEQVLDPVTTSTIQGHLDKDRARIIEDTLRSFSAPGHVVEIHRGPTITQYGVEPDFLETRNGKMRVRVAKISSLENDLALALAAPTIRIEAPVPGKSYVGIEVPNSEISVVGLREVLESDSYKKVKSSLKMALGKDVAGKPICADLTAMPHLLIAGTTNSGKSVCVNSILSSLLLNNSPTQLRMLLVDPKRVELTGYNYIPHLLAPVIVDADKVVGALQWAIREMEARYRLFSKARARNIVEYNKLGREQIPYLVVVIDELADLMMLAPDDTERCVTRLTQLARATGIHLIIATQRPSVDVVTGLIKANMPARISFMVASNTDSRVILDQPGAEKLLGRGDMLYQAPDSPAPVRLQGTYVSDHEIQLLVDTWKTIAFNYNLADPSPDPYANASTEMISSDSLLKQGSLWGDSGEDNQDPMLDEAINTVRREGKASVSMLQRRLRVGYNRAARLIDKLEEIGIIGPLEIGSQVREILDYGDENSPESEPVGAEGES